LCFLNEVWLVYIYVKTSFRKHRHILLPGWSPSMSRPRLDSTDTLSFLAGLHLKNVSVLSKRGLDVDVVQPGRGMFLCFLSEILT
jgi:hypothetical protein